MNRVTIRILRSLFPKWIWFNDHSEGVTVTFDDGPHPDATPIVLEVLKKHQVQAVFFCVGRSVEKYPELFQQIVREGHLVGNHTYHHENGWLTDAQTYLASVDRCASVFKSRLFRPPYGKLPRFTTQKILSRGYKIVLWSWFSYDFHPKMTLQKLNKRIKNISGGDILVFHDNAKTAGKIGDYLELTLSNLVLRKIPTQPLNTT